MMKNSKQNVEGKATEKFVAKTMKKHGYWATILPKKHDGSQPCDVVAIKKNKAYLIDAKHVREEEVSFPFDRIEPNQEYSFLYARGFASIENTGFAVFFERDKQLYWFPYQMFETMQRIGHKSVNMKDLKLLDEVLDNEDSNRE